MRGPVFKRIILASLLFGALGPLLAGLTVSTVMTAIEMLGKKGHGSVGEKLLDWVPGSILASAVAYYVGLVPAALTGLILAIPAQRRRRSTFIGVAILIAIASNFLYCVLKFFYDVGIIAACLSILPTTVLSWWFHRVVNPPPHP
jgi:hypothetical protein